ncbi:MAG: ABC transporter transmembrane domain-containing protein, partial [Chloroflexota bacterium]|nr:ABC transporter transmembrane domain-containing protein [Chloroflexota bacterium]
MSATPLEDQHARRIDDLPGDSSEFTVAGLRAYNRSSPVRWIVSHVWRFRALLIAFIVGSLAASLVNGVIPVLTGNAVDEVLDGGDRQAELLRIAMLLLIVVIARGIFDIAASYTIEVMAKRLERDARQELFTSLLGKSQTF